MVFYTDSLKVAAAFDIDCFGLWWYLPEGLWKLQHPLTHSPCLCAALLHCKTGKQSWDMNLGQILSKPCVLYLNRHSGKCSLSDGLSMPGWDEPSPQLRSSGAEAPSPRCCFPLDLPYPDYLVLNGFGSLLGLTS